MTHQHPTYNILHGTVVLILLIILTQGISAEPARRTTFTIMQYDGRPLTLNLIGDEHFHCLVTTDYMPVIEVDSIYYYAEVVTGSLVRTNIPAHDVEERDEKEKAFCEDNGESIRQKVSELWASRMTLRIDSLSTDSMQENGTVKGSSSAIRKTIDINTNCYGNHKGLVILVNFADLEMTLDSPQATFDAAFNEEGYSENDHIGSVHDYFYDQSYGQFYLTFDVVGPVTVSNSYSYYGKNSALTGSDKYPAAMVAEACKLADSQVDFSDYDWDGDGEVEQVFVVYAGYAESSGAPSNTIWPHKYSLSSAYYYNGDGEGAITLDGVVIDQYACSSELNGVDGATMRGIGTACHEFGHCFGLPDIYDTDYSGGFGMDSWDIMNSGSYNGPSENGEVPCGYSAMERHMLGWLSFEEISLKTKITDMPCIGDEPVSYAIYNEGNRDEFFTLENRQNKGWFTYVRTYDSPHGLLITHIDYDATVWANNDVNNNPSHQRMTIIPADGDYNDEDEDDFCGDPFPGIHDVTELSNTSHYSTGGKLFNVNEDGSYYMNKPIYDITEEDGLITFKTPGYVTTPIVGVATNITNNSFTANWNEIDGADSYVIELSQLSAEYSALKNRLITESFSKFVTYNSADGYKDLSDSLDLYTSEEGWEGYKVFTSSYGAKIGTSGENGYLRTPLIESNNGCVTVYLSARSYSGGGCVLNVSLIEYDFTFATTSNEISLTSDIEDYVLYFTDVDPMEYKIKFIPDGRIYISNVEVYDGYYALDIDGTLYDISTLIGGIIERDTTMDVRDTSYTFTNLDGTYYAYRVKAVVDDYETTWSSFAYVSLSDDNSIDDAFAEEMSGTETYYTLDGMKVTSPTRKGLYIRKQGAAWQKVMIH